MHDIDGVHACTLYAGLIGIHHIFSATCQDETPLAQGSCDCTKAGENGTHGNAVNPDVQPRCANIDPPDQ